MLVDAIDHAHLGPAVPQSVVFFLLFLEVPLPNNVIKSGLDAMCVSPEELHPMVFPSSLVIQAS